MNGVEKGQVGEKLPKGWKWVDLESVCEQSRQTINPSTPLAASLPYLSLEHIESNTGRILREPSESLTDEGLSNTFAFNSQHILYGKLRPYLNKVALPNFSGRCTTEAIPLIPKQNINKDYLAWILRRQETVNAAMRGKTGSRMPRANMTELLSLKIPLPPLPEQKRIVAILTDRLSTIDKARAATETQLKAAKALPAAYIRQMFDSPEAQKWKRKKLGKLTTVVRGSSPRPQGDSRYYGGDVPRLMVADVTRDGMYVKPKIDFLTEEGAKLSRPMKKDDVVMVVSGSPGLPGILAIDACIHDGFVGFRDLNTKTLINSFLFYYLKFINSITDAQAAGAIFRNLTTDQIKEFDIAVPYLETQELTVNFLGEKISNSRNLQQSLQSQLNTINKLPAALLRQAFNGEL